MKRALLISALMLGASLTACGDGQWFGDDKERPPLEGKRISVLDFDKDLRPEDDVKGIASFAAGESWQNDTWPQAGGYPSHAMQNLALGKQVEKVWSTDIGEGSRGNLPLTAQPVVAGKSIFTLDTEAVLSAFNTEDGSKRWSVSVADETEEDEVISGGIAVADGFVYVTAGYDELLSVDAAKGEIKWRIKLTAPSRAAPTVIGNRVFVTTMANSILALDVADGKVQWEYAGLSQGTGLIGAASPAATTDMVVPAFSSGEIYALRTANGSVAWTDNLANALKLGGLGNLSDIRGLPVIDENIVYAISYGGKFAAIDLNTGARVWQKEISSAKTPWIAGNRAFVISTDGQIIGIDKEKGTVLWVSQLARYKNKEDKTGPIIWNGPIMGGGRLMAFSSDGRVAEIDPEKGGLIREWNNGEDMRISPLIAGGTLYILGEDGSLNAYR